MQRRAKPPGQFSTPGKIQPQNDAFQYQRHLSLTLPRWEQQVPTGSLIPRIPYRELRNPWIASLLKSIQKTLQTSGSPVALGDRRKGELPSLKPARPSPATAFCRTLSSRQGATAVCRVPRCASSSQALPSPRVPKILSSHKLPFKFSHPLGKMRRWLGVGITSRVATAPR